MHKCTMHNSQLAQSFTALIVQSPAEAGVDAESGNATSKAEFRSPSRSLSAHDDTWVLGPQPVPQAACADEG
eukprot:scaffold6931_cov119-Isochrysis_galbana.AAC.10